MSDQFELSAELRNDLGKGASRRLRRHADLVPAIIYGEDKDPQPLTLVRKDLEKALENEAYYSQVISIKIGRTKQKAILKDLQRHPATSRVVHADFLRIDDKSEIKVHVPIHFLNQDTCPGVKLQGGVIQHQETDIEILCMPANIPEYIEVDMGNVEIGDIIHLSSITLPEGVISVELSLGEDHDLAIASVIAPRGISEEGEEVTPAEDEGADDTAEEGGSED